MSVWFVKMLCGGGSVSKQSLLELMAVSANDEETNRGYAILNVKKRKWENKVKQSRKKGKKEIILYWSGGLSLEGDRNVRVFVLPLFESLGK